MPIYQRKKCKSTISNQKYYYLKISDSGKKHIISKLEYETHKLKAGNSEQFNSKLVRKCFNISKKHYPRKGKMGPMTWDFMTSINEHKIILAYLQYVLDKKIEGSVVELGCHNGNTTVMIQRLLQLNQSKKEVIVYDSFQGFPDVKHNADDGWGDEGELKTSIKKFKRNLKNNKVKIPKIVPGFFSDIPDHQYPDKIAFAFYDGDLYQSTIDALEKIYHKMSPGGVIVFDDYKNPQQNMYPGVKKACEKFLGKNNKVEFIGTRNLLGSKDNFFNVKEEHISQAVLIC
tara:strand:- start:604 stop:1464 length:861 start_codon:yes stop_codon:yes gene_type:complete